MGFKAWIDRILYGEGNDSEKDDYTEDMEVAEEEEEEAAPAPQQTVAPQAPKTMRATSQDSYRTSSPAQTTDRDDSTNINTVSGSAIEMKVVKPEKLDNVTQIANYLLERKTVLLNLEDTNKDTARRLIDFMNGVSYAIGGNLRKVANCTFVVTPKNVSVSGEKLVDSSVKEEYVQQDDN